MTGQVGTTVGVEKLFTTLPVRHREFLRNVKKEFARMIQTLTAYCLVSHSVKITCSNQLESGCCDYVFHQLLYCNSSIFSFFFSFCTWFFFCT